MQKLKDKAGFKFRIPLYHKLIMYAVVLVILAVGTVTFFNVREAVVTAENNLIKSGSSRARYIGASAQSSFCSLNWIYVETFLLESVADEGGQIIFAKLIKPNGEVYLASDKKYYGEKITVETLRPRDVILKDYFFEETSEEGLLIVHPIRIGNDTWYVQLGLGLAQIRSMIKKEITRNTVLALLIISIGVLMSFYFSRVISLPIIELAKTAHLISEGRWRDSVTIKTSDEVGLLGSSFNVMMEKLKASIDAEHISKQELQAKNMQLEREMIEREKAEEMLQKANENLEMKVAARTKELGLANSQLRKELSEREEAETLYNTIANTSRAGVYIVQNGKFVFSNDTAARFIGFEKSEMLNVKSMDLIHPEDRMRVRKNAVKMLKGIHASPYEFKIISPDGRTKWAMESVTSIQYKGTRAVLGNFMDITEIKESKQLLEELKDLESSVLRAIPHAVIGFENRKVIFANDGATQVFGWHPEDLIGKSTRLLYRNDEEFNRFEDEIQPLFLGEKTVSIEPKYPFMHKDGRHLQCKMTATQFGEKSGIRKFIATVEDITEQRKVQLQLLQSEKMASIGQLAAGIAHEINNPTAFVSSNLKTMSDYSQNLIMLIEKYTKLKHELSNELDAKQFSHLMDQIREIGEMEKEIDIDYILDDVADVLEESQEGTDRIKKIVQDLKNFAHPGDKKLKAVNINEGIESTLNVVWNEIKYKATVEKDYGTLPLVECYSQQLNQVFMNMLVNAAQAIQDEGVIQIRTETNGDGQVTVEISDNGVGISDENMSRIFDPFFTTKAVGKGTGLGLHVAYDIIRKHQGTIDVTSKLGEGTTFTIHIPVSQQLH